MSEVIQPQEFGKLFMSYRDKFISIARSYVRDEAVAEDIVADSFTTFWDNREKYTPVTCPEAYILHIVRNKCLNHLRDKATRLRIEQQMHKNISHTIEADIRALESNDPSLIFRNDIGIIFKKFIGSMPELTRNIFLASRFENLTYQEISEKYNVSQRKVKREIQDVLSIMRQSLKDYLPAITLLVILAFAC